MKDKDARRLIADLAERVNYLNETKAEKTDEHVSKTGQVLNLLTRGDPFSMTYDEWPEGRAILGDDKGTEGV